MHILRTRHHDLFTHLWAWYWPIKTIGTVVAQLISVHFEATHERTLHETPLARCDQMVLFVTVTHVVVTLLAGYRPTFAIVLYRGLGLIAS